MKMCINFMRSAVVLAAVLGMVATVRPQTVVDRNDKKPDVTKFELKTVPQQTPTPAAGTSLPDGPEADAILPYFANYLREYRIGPNDVISVEVFGQCPDYCKTGITVPPTARISYPLIREGIMVGGKTVEEVATAVTKKLDEFIIDPKVTVTLDRAMSARYSVLGKVMSPGVHVLDRKVSVYEAVVESGGAAKDGDLRKVILYSYDGQGQVTSKLINLSELQRGRGEMTFLKPGDQVFVSGKGFSLEKVFDIISKASIIRLFMGSPF